MSLHTNLFSVIYCFINEKNQYKSNEFFSVAKKEKTRQKMMI
jgi:hypothetical protein